MTASYRSDYAGEFVILETCWSGGRKHETREWIPNPIENQHISGRAACIGSTVDRLRFDYTRLARHRGGLLSSKKLQTYGVGSISLEMPLDFAVETNAERLSKIKSADYHVDNIVYTTSRNCINNPGSFYLIPNRLLVEDLVTIVYLAAFDGHREIFLLGYTKEVTPGRSSYYRNMSNIFSAYPVDFYLVGEPTNMPESWLDHSNVRTANYQDWISYCDV